ncbi:MAG: hypothetical protein ABSG64_12695 [Solirubrobacteraceae bacterium]|jgi:hypothetical protein
MKRWLFAAGTTLLFALVLAASASAAQRYAAPNGTANLSCSQLLPCDIETAINGITMNMPVENDEVIVEPGSYYEIGTASTPLAASLHPGVDLYIHGVAGEPRPQIFLAVSSYGLDLNGSGSMTARYLDIEQSGTGSAVFLSDGTIDELIARTGAANQSGCVVIDATVTNSVCDGTGNDGYGLNSDIGCGSACSTSSTIRNSDLYGTGSGGAGVYASAGSGPATVTVVLTNVIARGGAGGHDLVTLQSAAGATAAITATHSDYVTVDTSGGGTATAAGTPSNIETDPALVNPAGEDFHETAASPTIDAGVTSPANGSLDFDGQTRTEGGLTDIGADEYIAPPTPANGSPSAVSDVGATLNATLNPGHDTTSYAFDYGTSPSLGDTSATGSLQPGLTAQPVAEAISGLTPGTTYYWKLTATNAAGTASTAVTSFETVAAPQLSELMLTPQRFHAAHSGASIAKRKAKTGTLVSYDDTEAATTTFTVEQNRPGMRSGNRCIARPAHPKKKPKRCIRVVVLGTFTHPDTAGANNFRFSGRVHGRRLAKGAYVLSAAPLNSYNLTGAASTASFHITG